MKRLYGLLLTLLFATSLVTIEAGSGKYWGIGLGGAAVGYGLGRVHGRNKRRREYQQQPTYRTEVVEVQRTPSLQQELEEERRKRRKLEDEVDDLERKNDRLERKNEKLSDQLSDLEERLKKLESDQNALW